MKLSSTVVAIAAICASSISARRVDNRSCAERSRAIAGCKNADQWRQKAEFMRCCTEFGEMCGPLNHQACMSECYKHEDLGSRKCYYRQRWTNGPFYG